MKLVHIALGNTRPVKDQLKVLGFKWLPVDKIWVQWLNHDDDSVNKETRELLAKMQGVVCIVSLADPFIRTCVDPINPDYNATKSNYDWKEDLEEDELKLVNSAMNPSGPSVKPRESLENHRFVGKQAELNKYGANSVRESINRVSQRQQIDYLYRNIVIKEVVAETAKAVQIKLEFFGGIGRNCHVCGAELDTEISRACGIGPVCAKNMGLPRPTLANATQVLAMVENLAKNLGEIGPVWIPKSCITILE